MKLIRTKLKISAALSYLCFWSLGAMASGGTLVIYRGDMPDTAAPAFFLKEHLAGTDIIEVPAALSNENFESLKAKNYANVVTFDCFLPATTLSKYAKSLNAPSLITFVKNNDSAYRGLASDAELSVIPVIVLPSSTHLEAASEFACSPLTYGATLLAQSYILAKDTPILDIEKSKSLRSYFATKGSSESAFKEIDAVTNEGELLPLITAATNYFEKAKSIVQFIVEKKSTVFKLSPDHIIIAGKRDPREEIKSIDVGYVAASTDVDLVGAGMLSKPGVRISLVKCAELNPLEDITQYSLRLASGFDFSADMLARHLARILPSAPLKEGETPRGGGQEFIAGFTVRASVPILLEAINDFLKGARSE